MNILVCVKQVPNTEELKVDAGAGKSNLDSLPLILNTFDQYAMETAAKLKDADASVKIVAVTIGPEKAKDVLKACLAVGADRAYLISDHDAFHGSDSIVFANALAAAAKEIEKREGLTFDLILTGKQAIDDDAAQVGPQLAEFLNLPQLTYAREISIEGANVRARRETEDGYMVAEATMPAVVTITKTEYDLRFPSVKTKMAANRAEIPQLTAADLGLDAALTGAAGSPAVVKETYIPQRKTGGVKIEEETGEQSAEKLAAMLSDAGII